MIYESCDRSHRCGLYVQIFPDTAGQKTLDNNSAWSVRSVNQPPPPGQSFLVLTGIPFRSRLRLSSTSRNALRSAVWHSNSRRNSGVTYFNEMDQPSQRQIRHRQQSPVRCPIIGREKVFLCLRRARGKTLPRLQQEAFTVLVSGRGFLGWWPTIKGPV